MHPATALQQARSAVTLAALLVCASGCLPTDERALAGHLAPHAQAGSVTTAMPQPPPAQLDAEVLRTRAFGEAPSLARRVAAGELPPVSERLPEHPLVVRPLEEIGRFGGTIHRAIPSEQEGRTDITKTLNENLLGYRRPFAEAIDVNLAESFAMSPDGRSAVFRLRKGLRWSDGAPFTVDDILFWYYDVLLEGRITQGVPVSDWKVDGKPIRMEKIDALTLRASADKPMGMLAVRFCHDYFALPKHYFARFHPRYNPAADSNDFSHRVSVVQQLMVPGVPRMSAWIPVQWTQGQRVVFERNPYYFKVDTAGNQLPYADRLSFLIVPDSRVALLKFTTGEIDLVGQEVTMDFVPALADQARSGRFLLHTRKAEAGPALYLNWDAANASLRQAFRDARVREALSVAINREEISHIVFFGALQPGGFAFSPGSPYFSAAAFASAAEYSPERARRLLDDAGYRDRDGDGFRELSDGRRFALTVDYAVEKSLGDMIQLIEEYWSAVGVKVFLSPTREEIGARRRQTGDFEVYAYYTTAGAEDPRNSPNQWSIQNPTSPFWHRRASQERTPWLVHATALMNEALETTDQARIQEIFAQLAAIYAEQVPAIGIGAIARPWAASTALGNVPRDGTFSSVFRGWSRTVYHEQLFIRAGHDPS